MPGIKSLVIRVEMDEALRAHNCQRNSNHRIEQGKAVEKRLREELSKLQVYTAERKQWVLRTCKQIRQARQLRRADRSHSIPGKCRACGQRQNCPQAL
jgi:hypothetical protein